MAAVVRPIPNAQLGISQGGVDQGVARRLDFPSVTITNGIATIPSSGDATYIHTQAVASALWTITHNLGKRPSVSVVDSTGRLVIGQIDYINANVVTVTFSAPFSGAAYLN